MLRNNENSQQQFFKQNRRLEIVQPDRAVKPTQNRHDRDEGGDVININKFHHHTNLSESDIFSRDLRPKLSITASGFDRLCQNFQDLEHAPTFKCSSFGNFQLLDLAWKSTFTLQQDPLSAAYIIYMPFSGHLDEINSPQTVSHQTAILINPDRAFTGIASETGQALLIWIDRQLIEEVLATLLDRTLKQPLLLDRTIDLTSDFGISLQQFVRFLALHQDSAQTSLSSLVQEELERALLTCLLKGTSNNYADEILYRTHGAFACYVTKARCFIESHLHEDLKLADIATAVGICPRLLQKAFAEHCDCSPMKILNYTRLHRIRQELERSSFNTRITDVMMRHGFTQGGKFAKEYQQLFGEKPSDTLKRSSQSDRLKSNLWQEIDDRQSELVSGGVQIGHPSPRLTGLLAKFNRLLLKFTPLT